jgi:transcriptional regulator with XRE-family HTH domain
VRPRPPFRRRRLGKRLRALREQAHLTLDEAAARLDKSRTSLFRIESGEYKADIHIVRSMMDLYDQWDEGLLDAVREAAKPKWFHAYGLKDMGYVDVETEASGVREYACQHIPGLLQTEAYIRAIFEGNRRRARRPVDNQVTVRLIRQERLSSADDPLELVAIVDEAVLHREVGDPEVMREQLLHLVEMTRKPTVTLQVLPLHAHAHGALDGAFTLLDFPEPEEPDLLYHAYVTGALHIENATEVREAKLVFEQLRSEALNQAESVMLIERLAMKEGVHYGPSQADLAQEQPQWIQRRQR